MGGDGVGRSLFIDRLIESHLVVCDGLMGDAGDVMDLLFRKIEKEVFEMEEMLPDGGGSVI